MLIAVIFLFIIGNASLAFLLYCSIQKGQWLDIILKWQTRLRNWDISGTTKGMVLHKILGGCELCFAHLISFVGFWFLVAFCYHTVDWRWVILYFVYVPTATNLSLYFIKKLYNGNYN